MQIKRLIPLPGAWAAQIALFLVALAVSTSALAGSCDDYAAQLSQMSAADQAIRSVAPHQFSVRFGTAWEVIDTQNLKRFRVLLDRCGWPVESRYGRDASNAAWLLVQHADSDRAFQRRALRILEQAVLAREAVPGNLAYLSDRLAVADGKPQPYGTQFKVENCQLVLAPIESREAVNRRRSAIAGMSTLEAYEAQAQETFAKSPCEVGK